MPDTCRNIVCTVAAFGLAALVVSPAHAQRGGRSNGTTLAGYKTIDICTVSDNSTPDDPTDDTWRYSGEVSVWNEGVLDTIGLAIEDAIQNKVVGQFTDRLYPFITITGQIPAGTTLATATVFPYSIDAQALPGFIRNRAKITITNHSGSLGTPTGPEPKATYLGDLPPPPCADGDALGCTYTRGYWGNKPGVVWPAPYDRTAPFYSSGNTWQGVLATAPAGNGYYILASQYIAAVLNQANGAAVPTGVQDTLDLASVWLTSNAPSACPTGGSCGAQKTWGGVLDDYNKGVYPGGPPHCGDEQ